MVGESRSLFSPDYAPEEIYEIAAQLMQKGGISPLQPGDGKHSRFQGSTTDTVGAIAQDGRASATAGPKGSSSGTLSSASAKSASTLKSSGSIKSGKR